MLLRIATPGSGRATVVTLDSQKTLEFTSDLSSAAFNRPASSGGEEKSRDLVITLKDGGVIELKEFFAATEGDSLPAFRLADGTEVAGAEFLRLADPNLDLATAAGPAESSAPESGGTNYSDQAGSLVDGVDRMGVLDGIEGFHSQRSAVEYTSSASAGISGGSAIGPVDPITPDTPVEPLTPLHMVTDLLHKDPTSPMNYWNSGGEPKAVYEYTGFFAERALEGENTTLGGSGDFKINAAVGTVPLPRTGSEDGNDVDDSAVYVSGLYAKDSGKLSATGDNIRVNLASGGAENGQSAAITGVRADGALQENEDYLDPARMNRAAVDLKAGDRLDIGISITGDTSVQDHSGVSYAGLAATELGSINGSAKNISVTVKDESTGGPLDAGGTFGLFAGYGFMDKDLPSISDFPDEYAAREYYEKLGHMQGRISNVWTEDGTRQSFASNVSLKADNDLAVNVEVGDHAGGTVAAAGAVLGDLNLRAGGNINLSASAGNYSGTDGKGGLHGMTVTASTRTNVVADGDVNISARGDGSTVSALRTQPFREVDSYSTNKKLYAHFSGNNVNFSAEGDLEGDHSVYGVDLGAKKNKISISAKDTASISATLHAGGQSQTVAGITFGAEVFSHSSHHLLINAPKVEIEAKVEQTGAAHTDRAVGILVENGAYATMDRYDERHLADGYLSNSGEGLESLSVSASGGKEGVGILVGKTERNNGLHLRVNNLDLDVSGSDSAVGISAQINSYVNIGSGWDNNGDKALTITIACTVTDRSALPGAAIALKSEGGGLDIQGGYSQSDFLALQGDILAKGNGEYGRGTISISLEGGNDTVHLDGVLRAEENGHVQMYLGDGNDSVTLNGGIAAGGNGTVITDMGGGNDILSLNGAVADNGHLTISGGSGSDTLVLQAPDADTFKSWYGEWVENGFNGVSGFEKIVIHGGTGDLQTWFQSHVGGVDVVTFSGDVNLHTINDAADMAGFAMNGAGDNDVLYARLLDGGDGSLLHMQSALNSGKINGLEGLVLDLADNAGQTLDVGDLNSLLGSVRSKGGTEVVLRADASDDLNLSNGGWQATGAEKVINGATCAEYSNSNSELGSLYVQLVTGS